MNAMSDRIASQIQRNADDQSSRDSQLLEIIAGRIRIDVHGERIDRVSLPDGTRDRLRELASSFRRSLSSGETHD